MRQPRSSRALLRAAWGPLRVARRMHDRLWDLRLGVDTASVDEHGTASQGSGDGFAPVPTPYAVAVRLLDHLSLGAGDVVVDVGCGAGRVVCLAARLPIAGAFGVEILPRQADRAAANAKRVRGRRAASVGVACVDAGGGDLPKATVYFLFNPFGWETMRGLLDSVELSRNYDNRRIRIVYYNPVFVKEIHESFPWISRIDYRDIIGHRVAVLEVPAETTPPVPHD